ncbi:MAG: cupin domain-containing protein [Desulfobacterales bacterium]|nr:cupin domain-containing protein [Desulfobacterales bacterium]
MEKMNITASFTRLSQDEKSDIELQTLVDGKTSFLIAELKPGKILPAHYHNQGSEIYHILSGRGKMETGEMKSGESARDKSGDNIAWAESQDIGPGDVFEIQSKVVHRLSNDGEESLRIVFITPPSHLGDDRFFI